jgi:Domain of unknown function DUF11
MKSLISVVDRKPTASFRSADSLPAIAPVSILQSLLASTVLTILILGAASCVAQNANTPNAQTVKSFGTISVSASSVIFDPDNVLSAAELADLNGGYEPSSPPVPAVKAMSFAAASGQFFEFSATGGVGSDGGVAGGPDGNGYSASNVFSLGSISGYEGPQFALTGVFTNGHPSGSPPADYSFSGDNEPTTFTPQLNQVFFIGDGRTGTNSNSGAPQLFIVPANATELWLGFADAVLFSGPPGTYGDNVGSLNVSGTLYQGAPSLGADLFLRIIPTPTTVQQGELLTYAFPVWNLGPDNADQEVLITRVPDGTTFDYIRISGTPGLGTCTTPPYGGTGQIICHENGSMAPNTTWTVRLTVKVTASSVTVITEDAATLADTLDPNLANNTATVSTTVQ